MKTLPRFDYYDRTRKSSALDAGWSARRKCDVCKVTRSTAQYDGDSTICKTCTRRKPCAS